MIEADWLSQFRQALIDQGQMPEVADAFIANSTFAELSEGFSDRPREAAKHAVFAGTPVAGRVVRGVNAGFDYQFAWLLIAGAFLALAIALIGALIGNWQPFQFWLLLIIAGGCGIYGLRFMRRYHRFVKDHNARCDAERRST